MNIGHLILGTIISKTQSGILLKVLCVVGNGTTIRYVADINVKVRRILIHSA